MAWRVAVAYICIAVQAATFASTTVFLDFTGDWRANLDLADDFVRSNIDPTYPWGNFTQNEKNQIFERTFSEIRRIFAGYDVEFTLSDPGGNRDRVNFSAFSGRNGLGPYGNTASNYLGNFGPNSDANLFLDNFALVLNGLPANATQQQRINAVAVEMGMVASHELGHIYGLNHWHKYAQSSITPANYASTGFDYTQSIMATPGPVVGVGKNLNPLERAIFDISGGSRFGGDSLVNQPVFETLESGDAGDTPATAAHLSFSEGESSGLRVAYHSGELDDSAADVDVYRFTTTSAGALTVNVLSGASSNQEMFLQSFNPKLRLIGPDGTSVLAEFDDTYFFADIFNQTSYTENGQTFPIAKNNDLPFMGNWPLAEPGTYYLEISPVEDNDIGDQYQILSTFDGTLLEVELPGDYNADDVVDAADYTLWRDNLSSGVSLPNDDTAGVGPDDYTRWKLYFGQTTGTGAGGNVNVAVPEPAAIVLFLVAAFATRCPRRRFATLG
jgi:hypothetical protein